MESAGGQHGAFALMQPRLRTIPGVRESVWTCPRLARQKRKTLNNPAFARFLQLQIAGPDDRA